MDTPIGIAIQPGNLGIVYNVATREVRAYLPTGQEYELRSWKIKLVDTNGNTTFIERKIRHG